MKHTVNESQFRDAFMDYGRSNNFSYAGLGELYEYLVNLEDDLGEEFELDVIALCCDYSEYTIEELESAYGYMTDDETDDWDLEDWADFLEDHTIVIPVSYRNSIAPDMNTESLIIQDF